MEIWQPPKQADCVFAILSLSISLSFSLSLFYSPTPIPCFSSSSSQNWTEPLPFSVPPSPPPSLTSPPIFLPSSRRKIPPS